MSRKNELSDFWDKVDVRSEDECWEWQRGLNTNGYGSFRYQGTKYGAHRFLFTHIMGIKLDKEECILHKCDNRKCCNFLHLWIGTHKENSHDCVKKKRHASLKRTHCKKGHEFTEENTRFSQSVYRLRRHCRECETLCRKEGAGREWIKNNHEYLKKIKREWYYNNKEKLNLSERRKINRHKQEERQRHESC